MSPEITTLLARSAELRAALAHELELTRIAFAPRPRTVTPVEVAPSAWLEARADTERTQNVRLVKFFRG